MNDPEVTMLDATHSTGLIAYSTALEAAGEAIQLVKNVPAPLKATADQVKVKVKVPGPVLDVTFSFS